VSSATSFAYSRCFSVCNGACVIRFNEFSEVDKIIEALDPMYGNEIF